MWDDDITDAYLDALAWLELDDDPPRYLLAGPARADNVVGHAVLEFDDDSLVIHAKPL